MLINQSIKTRSEIIMNHHVNWYDLNRNSPNQKITQPGLVFSRQGCEVFIYGHIQSGAGMRQNWNGRQR